MQNFFDTKLFPARRIDTLLINGHGGILGTLREKARA
jgi:hypothetical protein